MKNLCPVEDMVSSCAGLVTVNQESNTIGLVHYTTQEYFQRRRLDVFRDVNRDIIGASCLTYLSYDVFAKGYFSDSNLWSFLEQNLFYRYAAQNWAFHIQDTQQSVVDLALRFLMDDGKVSTSSQVLFQRRYRPQCCGIHLVAYFGLNDIMMRLVEEKDPDTNVTGYSRCVLRVIPSLH